MTPQEQQLLQGLTDRVNKTVLSEKDPDAEQFIFQQLGRNTDSLYILAQTVLVQQYALDQAKAQLDQLKQQQEQAKQQAQQPQKHTSFLGSLLGTDDKPAPAPPPPPPQQQYAPVQNTGYPPQQYGQPGYAQPGYGAGFGAGQFAQPGGMFGGQGVGGSSFLRSAATTAAGVAAGALAFEGVESLMHGFGEHAGYGQGLGGFGGGQPREEIVNNYYGDDAGRGRGDLSDRFAAAGDTPSQDVEDRRDDSSGDYQRFDDDSNSGAADYGTDDGGTDDGGSDSSGDDSSGDDFSGGDSSGDDNSF